MTKLFYKKEILVVALITIAIVVAVFLGSRGEQSKTDTNKDKILVMTTFYPLQYVATKVGGNLVDVQNLVPSGVESHDFEPSARDFARLTTVDLFVYNGADFEAWTRRWEKGSQIDPRKNINMANELQTRQVDLIKTEGGVDPHFWLDPAILKKEAEIVRDRLIEIDPLHKDIYTLNTQKFLMELHELDLRFRTELDSCDIREVIVLHEAFNYIAGQYKFKATAIAGISPEEEPSPRQIIEIINIARKNNITHIFSETIASPKFTDLVAREVGAQTLILNPVESLTQDEVQLGKDYVSIMQMNLENLKKAMVCKNR